MRSEVPEPLCHTVVTSFQWDDSPSQKSGPTAYGDEQPRHALLQGPISSAPLDGFRLLTHFRRPPPLPLLALDLAHLVVWQVISK